MPSTTWQEKVRAILRERGRGAKEELIRATGVRRKSLDRWLSGKYAPRGENDLIGRIAKALNVSDRWLRDPSAPFPPPAYAAGPSEPDDAVAPRYHALIRALGDPLYCDLLLGALSLFERARKAPPTRPTEGP